MYITIIIITKILSVIALFVIIILLYHATKLPFFVHNLLLQLKSFITIWARVRVVATLPINKQSMYGGI